MADFPAALDAALHGYYSPRGDFRSPVSSPRGLKARVGALEKAYGSPKAAALAAGIHPDTWTRWKKGSRAPAASSLARVETAHVALLRAGKAARRGMPTLISVKAVVACTTVVPGSRKSNRYNTGGPGAEFRTFNADRLTGPQIRDVVNAWAAGGSPDHVAGVLTDAIERAYGPRFEFEGNQVRVTIH